MTKGEINDLYLYYSGKTATCIKLYNYFLCTTLQYHNFTYIYIHIIIIVHQLLSIYNIYLILDDFRLLYYSIIISFEMDNYYRHTYIDNYIGKCSSVD